MNWSGSQLKVLLVFRFAIEFANQFGRTLQGIAILSESSVAMFRSARCITNAFIVRVFNDYIQQDEIKTSHRKTNLRLPIVLRVTIFN